MTPLLDHGPGHFMTPLFKFKNVSFCHTHETFLHITLHEYPENAQKTLEICTKASIMDIYPMF